LSSSEARYLKINFDEILSKLREYARSKAEDQHARAIVLAGSFARGNYTGTSDVDILVIADNAPVDVLERYALFSNPEFPIDLEPRVYTTKEFVNMIRQGNRFALESLELGVPLHGEPFLRDLKKSFSKSDHLIRLADANHNHAPLARLAQRDARGRAAAV
jgi:predicted nucleotidyltransferase